MEKHELEIEILADGTVHVETFGVKGARCLEYAQLMEEIVGETKEKTLKSEYYERPPNVRINQSQHNRNL
ncbi:MAG: DUF2997 domain-containing protein [Planctomycetota bacterium]|jgi:hypothetical protein